MNKKLISTVIIFGLLVTAVYAGVRAKQTGTSVGGEFVGYDFRNGPTVTKSGNTALVEFDDLTVTGTLGSTNLSISSTATITGTITSANSFVNTGTFVTGSNAGTDLCFGASGELCKCTECS